MILTAENLPETKPHFWPRLVFLFAISLTVALASLNLIVALPLVLMESCKDVAVIPRDLMMLGFAGCGILMATSWVFRVQLTARERNFAKVIAAAGMLIIPGSLALSVFAV